MFRLRTRGYSEDSSNSEAVAIPERRLRTKVVSDIAERREWKNLESYMQPVNTRVEEKPPQEEGRHKALDERL